MGSKLPLTAMECGPESLHGWILIYIGVSVLLSGIGVCTQPRRIEDRLVSISISEWASLVHHMGKHLQSVGERTFEILSMGFLPSHSEHIDT